MTVDYTGDLSQFVSTSIQKYVLGSHTLRVDCIAARLDPPAQLFEEPSTSQQLDRLVLISKVGSSPLIVFGMKVSEFVVCETGSDSARSVHAYIEKIDSTGFFDHSLARSEASAGQDFYSISRSTLFGYIQHLYDRYKSQAPEIWVHTFARSMPEYLFPDSKLNPGKYRASNPGAGLVRWWKSTLDQAMAKMDPQPISEAFWLVPGEGEALARRFFEAPGCVLKWNWGLPWPAHGSAAVLVPRFPDDPKGRIIADSLSTAAKPSGKPTLTVKSLVNMLECSGESSNQTTCYFVVRMQAAHNADEPSCGMDRSREGCTDSNLCDHKAFEAITKELGSGCYSSQQNAVQSSDRLIKLFRETPGTTCSHIRIENVPKAKGLDETAVNSSTAPATTITSLQGLIKKKSKTAPNTVVTSSIPDGSATSSIASTSVVESRSNDIQSLVKRKQRPPMQTNPDSEPAKRMKPGAGNDCE
ncbi:histone acetylation protein-domain-containing protein [Polychytrium aggregatum]|uniref:histone acetylation protein-domain-containing protein n=1 Tax=Polychytrium aggregatum TaxID=110093 RepID=UPI0022FEE4DB|nr:histone acetylation protein-domain-containing protein [Polychytrium aggregatum]KAI9203838.1 histone acetylation protein-domain-containing protein [Polychytrium aggregatum]